MTSRRNEREQRRKERKAKRSAAPELKRGGVFQEDYHKRILIVGEGVNTEPSYFEKFRIPGVKVVAVGLGEATRKLVKDVEGVRAEEERKQGKPFDEVWVAFDKDSFKDFEQAVKVICETKTIYIYGLRSSSTLATFLGYYLNLIFGNVKVISTADRARLYEELHRISEEDVMIGITFPRYSQHVATALQFAMDRKAKVVAISDSKNSPIAQTSDYFLLARSGMATIVDSLVAPLSMINALIVATVIARKQDVTATFKDFEKIWQNYGVYNMVADQNIKEDTPNDGN